MNAKNWVRLLGAVVLGMTVGQGGAQAVDCTEIHTLPGAFGAGKTIVESGCYYLTSNLDVIVSGPVHGITIAAGVTDVVLDLGGFQVNSVDIDAERTGIFCAGCSRVTVRNGTVNGFRHGLIVGGAAAHENVVEDMRVTNSGGSGINVGGRGAIVRHNFVLETGKHLADSWGIGVLGSSHRVIDNDIVNMTKKFGSTGRARGIWVNNGARDVLVVNNRTTSADWGVVFDGSSGAIRDNLHTSVPSPYVPVNGASWVNAGNNF